MSNNTTPSELARPSMAGNGNALKHGVYALSKGALKLRARSVRRLVTQKYEECPWLMPTDRSTVRSWAEVVRLKAVAYTALETLGMYRVDGKDVVGRRLLTDYMRLSNLELQYADALGFTVRGRYANHVHAGNGRGLAEAPERDEG